MRQLPWLNRNADYRRLLTHCSWSLKGPLNLHHHYRPLAGRRKARHIMGSNAVDLGRAQAQNACSPGPGSHVDCLQSFLPMAVLTDSYKVRSALIRQCSRDRQGRRSSSFFPLYNGWDTLHCCRWPVNLPSCIRSSLSALGLAMLRLHMETLRAFCCHPAGQSLPAISQQPADAGGESITARPWLYSCATTS